MSDRTTTPRSHRGAVALGERGGGRRRPAWLMWLLALLAIAVIAAILIALLSGGDDDKTSGKSGASAQSQPETLTSNGQSLLPLPAGGKLTGSVGQDTVGTSVVVQAVNSDRGFWIGTSAADRVYVEYGGAAGKTESGFKPSKIGQHVDLDGPVRAAPANPAKVLKLSAADAAQVKAEGAYINANKVSPAQTP
jgi:hypothetical protein